MDQNGPLQAKMDHFGLASAKIQFEIKSLWPKRSFGPFWAVLVQYTFRQYRGHPLTAWLESHMAIFEAKKDQFANEAKMRKEGLKGLEALHFRTRVTRNFCKTASLQ